MVVECAELVHIEHNIRYKVKKFKTSNQFCVIEPIKEIIIDVKESLFQ